MTTLDMNSSFTVEGVYEKVQNPEWGWWSFKPRFINSDKLQEFYILETKNGYCITTNNTDKYIYPKSENTLYLDKE